MRLSNPFRIVVFPLLLVLFTLSQLPAWGQYNVYSFDQKYTGTFAHFGILMGYNQSNFHVQRSERFLFSDSIRSVESTQGPGFTLGIISNIHIGNNFDIRFLPSFSFAERDLNYKFFNQGDVTQGIESVNLEFPLLLKFKSNPYKDLRMYVLGGIKYDYDLASNAKARNAKNLVKVGAMTSSSNMDLGSRSISPISSLHLKSGSPRAFLTFSLLIPKLNLSNVLDRLFTRSILVVFNFEG